MCGIAGILNVYGAAADPGVLGRMTRMVEHRGPDATSTHIAGNVGLGHTRLSIIDLAGGGQPMPNADRSLWITFNGEIFNYLELRRELIQKGYRFTTQSDTEVILHLYEDQGEDCVLRMNGQWAFAIWDVRRERLFLSRDRLGIRPLFYSVTPRALVFGSEIKCILAHPDVSRELNFEALGQIFTYWCRVTPGTVFKGVLELPPGHSMTVERGNVSVRPYWQLDFGSQVDGSADSAEELLELLIDATRLQLRSDVPVGAYLSGGIDSTVTTALIRKFSSARLKTFSVGFEDGEFDESNYQEEAVRYLDTEHEQVRCTARDIAEVFPDVIWHVEQPILRTAPAPMYLLSRLVRESGYKVVLTGEGSDEMFGGYDIFKEAKIRRFWASYPHSKMRPLLLRRLYPYLKDMQRMPDAYLQKFFRVRAEDLESPFFSHLPRWELTSGLARFFSRDVTGALGTRDAGRDLLASLPGAYADWDGFSQAQYLEAAHLLPGYILSSQGDRVAMAHAVECRHPFLDHRVVEFASRVPAPLKMKALSEKYLLKQSVKGLIPESIRERSKQPYRAPDGKCFFAGARQDYVNELLAADRIRQDGIFDPGAVDALLSKFRDGRSGGTRDNMALVGILSTQIVVDRFIRRLSLQSNGNYSANHPYAGSASPRGQESVVRAAGWGAQ